MTSGTGRADKIKGASVPGLHHEVCECGHCRCGHTAGFQGCEHCKCVRYTWPGRGADITKKHEPSQAFEVPR